MTRTLETLQADFFARLHGEGLPAGVESERGFEVYREAYAARLREAIEDDFAASLATLHDERRESLFADFLSIARSRHWTLNAFGATWLEFLKTRTDLPESTLELAELEWARQRAYFAEDERESPAHRILLQEEPRVLCEIPPGFRLLSFAHPVLELLRGDRSAPARPQIVGLWADEGRVEAVEISRGNAALMETLLRVSTGADLERELGAGANPPSPEEIQAFFAAGATAGFLRLRHD